MGAKGLGRLLRCSLSETQWLLACVTVAVNAAVVIAEEGRIFESCPAHRAVDGERIQSVYLSGGTVFDTRHAAHLNSQPKLRLARARPK